MFRQHGTKAAILLKIAMSNKIFTIIVVILGLVLLGIFTAWLLVSRGYVAPSSLGLVSSNNSGPAEPIFPSGESGEPGKSGGLLGLMGVTGNNASSSILISTGQLDKQLVKLNTRPIGALLELGEDTILFFERTSGNLFQMSAVAPDSPVRITNTTLPRVVQAWGGLVGSTTNFVIRTNNDRPKTELAVLARAPETASTSASSLFLGTEEEIGSTLQSLTVTPTPTAFDFAVSPTGRQLAFLQLGSGGTDLVSSNWDGSKREKLSSLPLTQLNLAWPASTTIAISTRANSASDGLLYFYDTRTKKLELVMSGVKGLAAKASPNARYVLYSGSAYQGAFAALYDRKTGKIDRLPFKTLVEKCVWGQDSDTIYCGAPPSLPPGNYPDAWYQGTVNFSDNLWQLDVASKRATLLFNPELNNLGESIDATQLTMDETNRQLYLVNKNNFSLWRLSLGTSF